MYKRLKGVNWKYAIGELVLIFLGITLALAFNNWNENQKRKNLEAEMLREIRNGIEADLEDITSNIRGFTTRSEAHDLLIKHLEERKPMSDSLEKQLPWMRGTTMFITNITPYETLKSRGFGLIGSDSLRTAIMHYYDVSQDWIIMNEKEYLEHYIGVIKPILIKHFSLKNRMRPYDFEALFDDREVIQNLRWANTSNYYQLELYQNIKKEAEHLIEMIDNELGDS